MDSFSRRPGRFHLVRAKPSPINLIDPQFTSGIQRGLRLSAGINLSMARCRRIERQIQGPELVLSSIDASSPVTLFSRRHEAAGKCIASICVHILQRCVIQQFFHHFALRLNISVDWIGVSALPSDRVWEKPAAARKVPSVLRAISTMVCRKKNEADVSWPGTERPNGLAFPAFVLPKDAYSTIKSLPGRRREAEVETRERASITKQTSPGSSTSFPRNLLKGFEKRHDQDLPHTAMLSIASMAINLSFKCSINLYSGRISLIMEERTARNSRNQGELDEVYAASKGLEGSALNLVFSTPRGYAKATSHEEIYSRNESPYVSPNNMQHITANSSNEIGGKALPGAEMPKPSLLDLAHVTDQVYAMLERKIKMERERRGIYGL